MSSGPLEKDTILGQIANVLEVQEKIGEYIEKRLCLSCEELIDEEWENRRKDAFKFVRGLVDKYAFSKKLPRNEL
ncbi:MAG: hypothetical protein EAX87_11315, partial [Candidatus Thorarchaeota archaeon]|nr:hypothetical protein [Candidatus Thorarchaeota archaeon]